MSTTIKANCPTCGDVRLSSHEVVIRTREGQGWGQYRFNCRKCGKIILKDASEKIIQLLRDNYVVEEIWELPLEILERPTDGTLAEDDVIDLGLAFEDGTAFDKITKRNEQQ